MQARTIKTAGYLISSLSVILLGVASWSGLEDKPLLRLCLVAGMVASIAGMACRWVSYEKDHRADTASRVRDRRPADPPAATRPTSGSARRPDALRGQ
jgi:hypothetical protein